MKICTFLLLIALSSASIAIESATQVIVHKKDRIMLLMNNGNEIARYKISIGGNPQGHKQQEGDQRTPEGKYVLDYKKSDSAFYKAIHISYPNKQDKANAKKLGVSPGGFIMIHGQNNKLGWLSSITQLFDWTDGCIAVNNAEMDEIWKAVDAGTPIIINP
ncbi:MAG: L,D-transpeptidase family protein [Maribacter sp.]|nr:L,D-transpeptidase family protein [Maribacter sp.]